MKERAAKKSHTGYTKCEAKEMFTEEDKTSREEKKQRPNSTFALADLLSARARGNMSGKDPVGHCMVDL